MKVGWNLKIGSFSKLSGFRGSFSKNLKVCERSGKQLQRRGGVWDEQKEMKLEVMETDGISLAGSLF